MLQTPWSPVTNLIVALGNNPWPCTLGLARVQVAPNQKLCSLTEAMDSAREHFNREKGLEAAHYYLTPVYTKAPYLLSDVGLQAEDGTAMAIGVTALSVNPRDNAVNLTASEGAMSTFVLHHLLHLMTNLVLIPPQLSHPAWTRMRRMKIGYESFIHFPAAYIPPNVLESECNSQQLTLMGGLYIPKPGVLLDLAKQLDSLRTASPRPKVNDPESGDKHGVKDETPKKIKPIDTEDTPKKHHKSHNEKGQLKQSPTEKSPASLTCKHDMGLKANRLGDVVAQACLSVARMMRVVESTHNSKIVEALLTRQHLEKASAKAIDSVMDEIQGACTPADVWQVEKRISAYISCERAKAYKALVEQHHSKPKLPTGKDGPFSGSSEMAEVEEEICKSISDLISTTITKGAKVPGGHRVALTSNILWLVHNLPLNPVLVPCIDLPLEKECRIILGEALRSVPASHGALSSLPSSPLTGGMGASASSGRPTIKFSQAMIRPITHMPPAMDYTFFKKPLPVEVPAPPKGWGTLGATRSPMSKAPPKSSLDDLDTAEPMMDLMVRVEDDNDKTFAPCKMDSSKLREAHRSSKWQGSPPAKKACTKCPASWKTSKSKSHKASHTLRDEWEEREGSRKEPKYKEMCYLTFAPVMKLE